MSKISELSDGGSLQSTDYLIAVRSGGNVKVQLSELPSGIDTGGNIEFGDNEKAIFGAGSDLQIYHDGSNSYIDEQGSGALYIRGSNQLFLQSSTGDNYLVANDGGALNIRYAGSIKLATTNTGIDVTGTVTADTATLESAAPYLVLSETDQTDLNAYIGNSAGKVSIRTISDDLGTLTKRFEVDHSTGDISFYDSAGSSQSFFWDASAERLGLGTTSPDAPLHISQPSTGTAIVRLEQTDTTLVADQAVGVVEFEQNDAAGAGVPAKLGAYAEDANAAVGLRFYTGTGATANERMRIDSSGRVGIGTSSPTELLHIEETTNSTDVKIRLRAFNSSSEGRSAYVTYSPDSRLMGFGEGGDELNIDQNGNLLVGTTTANPTSIANNTPGVEISNTGGLRSTVDADPPATFNRKTDDGLICLFRRDGSTKGSVSISGSTTSYNTSSDARLKENIADAEDAGAKVDAIQVRQFDWKVDGSHQDYGMVAQELLTVAPEAVSGDPESDDMMGVDYSKLVPMLVKEIQSLRARVTQLEGV